ncbi:MAG TPA: IS1595 family transposase, partial [Bacteroidia bacterium]|nr:IS1595 family transposase [Bacteroidia bacterium]
DAKKGMSSMQLSRSLKISYRTAWFCAMKVRCSMLAQEKLLSGTVEMDATYIGGRPKYRYNPANPKAPIMKGLRGKGTKKIPVVAMVERGGRVVFKVMEATPNQKTMVQMLKHYGDMENIQMMTDDGSEFKAFKKIVPQQTVNHSQYEYVRDEVHTNTVEGLFGLVKSSIKGQYHSLSKKYLPFYLSEFAYKYNVRSKKMDFLAILRQAVSVVKQVVRYKPVRDTMQIAYGR